MAISLIEFVDDERNPEKFNLGQRREAEKLMRVVKTVGLPEGFTNEDVNARREKLSGKIYLSNKQKQMCMFNEEKLEIYYRCPKCGNEGFKNTLRHSSRCDAILW